MTRFESDEESMHREMEKVLGPWLVMLVARALAAVALAVVITDLTLGDSGWSKLVVVAVALASIALVGLRVAAKARSVAERVDGLRLAALDELLADLPEGPIRTELECQRRMVDSDVGMTVAVDTVLERVRSRHPDLELRSAEGNVEVASGVESMVERLVWDAREAGARRLLAGWRLVGDRLAIVVIDDGAHRPGPASLAGLARIGVAGFDRRYEGGWVASTVDLAFNENISTLRALPSAVMAR